MKKRRHHQVRRRSARRRWWLEVTYFFNGPSRDAECARAARRGAAGSGFAFATRMRDMCFEFATPRDAANARRRVLRLGLPGAKARTWCER